MNVRNTPFPASWLKNALLAFGPFPPRSPPDGADSFSAIPISTGNAAATARRTRFRRRRNTRPSSDLRNLQVGITAAASRPASAAMVSVDIETLTGKAHEQVLEAGRDHAESAYPHTRGDELGADALGLDVAEQRGCLAVGGVRLGQAESGEDLDGLLDVAGPHADSGRPGVPQIAERSLEHELAGAHDADMRAHLLHLGEQVRRHEHRGAFGGDLPDQRTDFPGALRVEPVRRLVKDDQVPGLQQA